jgi:hypothetical protein
MQEKNIKNKPIRNSASVAQLRDILKEKNSISMLNLNTSYNNILYANNKINNSIKSLTSKANTTMDRISPTINNNYNYNTQLSPRDNKKLYKHRNNSTNNNTKK